MSVVVSPGRDSLDDRLDDVFDGPVPEHELALHHAIKEKNLFQVMSLLEKDDINVNWPNPQEGNRTALHLAVTASDPTMVALLLGRGAEVHLRDDNGQTPMNIILDKGDNQILKLVGCKAISSLEDSKAQLELLSAPDHNRLLTRGLLEKTLERRERTTSAPASPFVDKKARDMAGQGSPRRRVDSNAPSSRLTKSKSKELAESETQVEPTFNIDTATAEDIEARLNALLENPKQLSKYQTHFPRISAMSELLKISHFKTVKNIWISVLLIAIANTLLYNYFESGVILDFSLFFWSFGQMDHAIVLWTVMFIYSFSAPFLQKAIVNEHLSPRIAYLCYIFLSVLLFIYVPKHIRAFNFPPATSMFVMCETMRLWMKMHSYLMVNRSLRLDKATGSMDPNVQIYPRNVTYGGYFYFLWAPTLVYQISYPRNKTVRWGFVIATFFEAIMTVLYTYAIFARYCMPYFHEMDGDYKSLILGIFKVMMPGTAVALMAFYGLLHSWFNAWAEVTRFADRQFYTDWWNATGWSQYYRKWNSVVHNFLHRHIFLECKETLHLSTNGAMWVTFLLSAIAHEYIIACALGFWKPVLLLMFSIPGVLFVYLTSSFRGWNGWNVFMWCMLIVGHGMLVGLYRRAWHYHVEMGASMPWWGALWIA